MHKLAACFLLFVGLLHPLCCLPVSGSREAPLQLPAPDEEARLALEGLERASLLRLLPEALGAESSARLRQAGTGVLARAPLHFMATEFAPRPQLLDEANPVLEDKDPEPDVLNPRGDVRKVPSGQEPNVLLSRLLARSRKQQKQHGAPLECFWKYCV